MFVWNFTQWFLVCVQPVYKVFIPIVQLEPSAAFGHPHPSKSTPAPSGDAELPLAGALFAPKIELILCFRMLLSWRISLEFQSLPG